MSNFQPGTSSLRRFALRVDGFNKRPLRLCDLYTICEDEGIEVIELQMRRLHGGAFEEDGYKFIFLNSLVSYAEQIVAGFHELFHTFNHVGDGVMCYSKGATQRLSKQEKQAQIAGVLALMPLSSVFQMTIEDMMREFDVSRKVAQFRFRIFQEYQF